MSGLGLGCVETRGDPLSRPEFASLPFHWQPVAIGRVLFARARAQARFTSREQLKGVPGLGEATFVQAAGFLKIEDGENPLDATWIHPESYEVATASCSC